MRTFLSFFLLFSCFFSSAQNPGDQFFSAWTVHEIRFQFSQTGYWDSLKANYLTDTYMSCDVSIDGQAYATSGVKFKGNSSYNNQGKKKPFRIDLAEFVDDQSHDGLKKMVLNNGFKDPTLLRERLVLDFLQAHDIAAPRASFARLYVNDHYWGLYTVVEDVGKPFLEQHYGNKGGNLFKGDPKGSLTWKGAQQSLYETDYELKTNEDENDWTDLIRFIDVLNNTPAAQLPDSLAQHLDLDSWFDYWATHNLFVNLDSYVGSGHNYYLYHNTETDRFEWITWDVNEAFGTFQMGLQPNALKTLPFTHIPQPPQQRPMMNRMLPDASLKQAYADHLCTLLADFSNEAFDSRIDSLADLIRPYVYADTLKFYSNAQFEQNISQDISTAGPAGGTTILGLKPFIAARRSALYQQLAGFGCAATETAEAASGDDLIRLLPNPATDRVVIESEGPALQTASLWSADGRRLADWRFDGQFSVELPLSDYPAGIFYLEIKSGSSVHLRRLSIVR